MCKERCKVGGGPKARHFRWRTDNNLKEDDAGVCEREVGSEILKAAVVYDQLDISNLASFEHLCRHMQFIEEGYRQKAEEKRLDKSKDVTSAMAEHFGGKPRMAGGAIVSPALLKHVSEKAAQDYEILKQQRKAAEVRALMKKK